MRTINKDILKLAIPSILANITVPIVGMVDIAVAGHLDAEAATMIGGIAIGIYTAVFIFHIGKIIVFLVVGCVVGCILFFII